MKTSPFFSSPAPVPRAATRWLDLSVLLLAVSPAKAVMFYYTGATNFNTTPPTKTLTNSGWQYQGAWVGFSGTVVSSNAFVTAKHIHGAVGRWFLSFCASFVRI